MQVYLGLNGLLLFWITSAGWHRLRHRSGLTFGLYAALYSVTRFAIEVFRGDQARYFWLRLSAPQVMCLATLSGCVIVAIGAWLGWLGRGIRRPAPIGVA